MYLSSIMHHRVKVVGDVVSCIETSEVGMVYILNVFQSDVKILISVAAVLLVKEAEGVADLVQYGAMLNKRERTVTVLNWALVNGYFVKQ